MPVLTPWYSHVKVVAADEDDLRLTQATPDASEIFSLPAGAIGVAVMIEWLTSADAVPAYPLSDLGSATVLLYELTTAANPLGQLTARTFISAYAAKLGVPGGDKTFGDSVGKFRSSGFEGLAFGIRDIVPPANVAGGHVSVYAKAVTERGT